MKHCQKIIFDGKYAYILHKKKTAYINSALNIKIFKEIYPKFRKYCVINEGI